ncbi:NUDIX domain-containing protein [Candidatus Woesearchaeota archaeon]|jgi:8-oxo-dGTP diphosphatase|nr:NUDIX domain-containing protein [Candidatus Woesearchaeota archaeon]MBT6045159.1 NUDIX domain-containing protein [Candidatus Woesearchaeota archaeon]
MISRALIIKDNQILLIHRFKKGLEYYVTPGGHIEEGESEEEALIREIKEETNLDAKVDKKLWTLINPKDNSKNHFFLVIEFSGEVKLGGPELERNCEEDKHILEWHNLNEIKELKLFPKPLKEKILLNHSKAY